MKILIPHRERIVWPDATRRRFNGFLGWFGKWMFETWISSDPYSESVARYPNDPTKYGWPGSYKDIRVDMCWMAWMEAWRLGDKCREGAG